MSRHLHGNDEEKTPASAFIHSRKITNTAEQNDDRNLPIHQNEEQCNFFAHQAPVTLRMGELYYSWHLNRTE